MGFNSGFKGLMHLLILLYELFTNVGNE